MRVLVAMSGGVDSSVAAALLVEAGHEVVGATMKLWGGPSDTGCCSVDDVEDARRVAEQIGIVHRVFNFSEDFETKVVDHYVAAHAAGATPNPCIECNRHLKFRRFLDRAIKLRFDAVATGHHARVVRESGRWRLRRGADRAKDQSYVLSVLGQEQLARILLPVGDLTKAEVRARAAELGLRTAAKADSQDVCFISTAGGREAFLGDRMPLHAGRVVDAASGADVGTVDAVELVTVGQRRGLGGGATGGQSRRYAVSVDTEASTVLVGSRADLLTERTALRDLTWVDDPVTVGGEVLAQVSAHGPALPAIFEGERVTWGAPQRRVAPGQTVALYEGDAVVGAGLAA
ncbi:MAG TPA: tRNA 2-thiouridine(34) synthase MnmA [Acidimicrobiales bacterium]|nr:tRNA 2-thiouridine(34) synthase MnmA [Acidimicrobiales bacterium]